MFLHPLTVLKSTHLFIYIHSPSYQSQDTSPKDEHEDSSVYDEQLILYYYIFTLILNKYHQC